FGGTAAYGVALRDVLRSPLSARSLRRKYTPPDSQTCAVRIRGRCPRHFSRAAPRDGPAESLPPESLAASGTRGGCREFPALPLSPAPPKSFLRLASAAGAS